MFIDFIKLEPQTPICVGYYCDNVTLTEMLFWQNLQVFEFHLKISNGPTFVDEYRQLEPQMPIYLNYGNVTLW